MGERDLAAERRFFLRSHHRFEGRQPLAGVQQSPGMLMATDFDNRDLKRFDPHFLARRVNLRLALRDHIGPITNKGENSATLIV